MCVCVCDNFMRIKRLYTKDLIALVQLSTEVSWPPCQDERDKDSLSILSPNDVESQTCGASVDQDSARLPRKETGDGGKLPKITINY